MTDIIIPPRPSWLKRKPTRTTDAAERAAHKFGVDPAQVLALMPEALGLLRQEIESTERARSRARQLTGLDARQIASRENKYLDYSTVPNFDTAARDVASEFPELGWDSDGHDTPAEVWSLIRAGKQPIPCRHSDCVAELAASWCEMIETEYFPDDADGFNPDDFEPEPAYVAGTIDPACDVQPTEETYVTTAQPASENPGRRIRLRTSRAVPAHRDDRRREAGRSHPRPRVMPEVRSGRDVCQLVRADGACCGPGHGVNARPRLSRAMPDPVYVAGRAISSGRSRDGPRMAIPGLGRLESSINSRRRSLQCHQLKRHTQGRSQVNRRLGMSVLPYLLSRASLM